MNRAVSGLVEQGAVADDMLASCCEVLRVDRAGLYMRGEGSSRFRLVDSVGTDHFPQTIEADGETLSLLDDGTSLQRAPGGHPGPQRLLRTLQAELVHGLTLDGELTGLVALGAKPGGGGYTAEDATFLTAVSRLTGVALHCAKVHGDITRLNEDLQLKIDKISEQSRQIELLQGQLAGEARPRELAATSEFRRDGIKGNSPAMQQVLATVRKVAGSESSVLIRGESGTGKELLAKAIHDNSDRRDGPLVTVHCAALSPSLLESELFGHVKGAFTDAREDKIGRFALADGGSLFLDEIGDVSLDVQVKLLRVLQERTFEPVGGSRSMTVDVRLIAATHQNLERLIAAGKFREDLYYRLNVITVTLPPLRERRDDIFELAVHFLRRATERSGKRIVRITDEALESLRQYDCRATSGSCRTSWSGPSYLPRESRSRSATFQSKFRLAAPVVFPPRLSRSSRGPGCSLTTSHPGRRPRRVAVAAATRCRSRRNCRPRSTRRTATRPRRPGCWGCPAARSTAS